MQDCVSMNEGGPRCVYAIRNPGNEPTAYVLRIKFAAQHFHKPEMPFPCMFEPASGIALKEASIDHARDGGFGDIGALHSVAEATQNSNSR
jgi:hypothetical protein